MLETLAAKREIGALPREEATVAHALRLWVVMRKGGRCAMTAVAGRLGTLRAAAHFHLLLEEIGAAWPEAFAVSPPCCRFLSHDEALLADMIRLGRAGDRPGFDRLLGEMLPQDERERLFLSASLLGRMLVRQAPPRGSGDVTHMAGKKQAGRLPGEKM